MQELVGGADCAELRQFLGRQPYTPYTPYPDVGHDTRVRAYQRLGLVPITSTEFWYDELFRDVDHLAAYLQQTPANLGDWRLGPKPYVPARDRGALELYARYHCTSRGIHLLKHRWVFALRRGDPPRYPVDALDAPAERTAAS